MGRFAFLVIGAGRGGTSLLAGLLDAHPGLDVAFEAHTFPYLLGHRMTAEHDSVDARLQAFTTACLDDAAASPSPRWGNKVTTEQIAALGEVGSDADVAAAFLDRLAVPAVFVLGDGRTCMRSKVNRTGQSPRRRRSDGGTRCV
jgi:hypothetical protein